MFDFREIISDLPPMKSGEELRKSLRVLPDYNISICEEDAATRLMALSDLYSVYVPTFVSEEVYSKLYLALMQSLKKKSCKLAILQQNENFKSIQGLDSNGIIGGSDSFSIIGTSGIGKSCAIGRSISMITGNRLIDVKETQSKIIPCVIVQTPFDSSVKSLLLEILRKVDEFLGSNFCENAIRSRATVDVLIGNVSQIALNHIGMIVVDEIQNVCNSRNGKNLIGVLTQLINASGISICMVGTPESEIFFESAMQLARRSLGLQYKALDYGNDFTEICEVLFSYQYTKKHTNISDSIKEWLYEHSGGIVSVVVSLIHDAQEISILNGKEELNITSLGEAYTKRLTLLHSYIEPSIVKRNQTTTKKKSAAIKKKKEVVTRINEKTLIADLMKKAKREETDIISLLKENVEIVEVTV